jgi:iron complex transport system ATP-binding protein
MGPMIRINQASFSYDHNNVFSDVSFELHPGEVLCLLGCNGCGKTTLLRCISGALRLEAGNIHLDGRDLSGMTATDIARRIGFVFQEHSAPFPYSVIDVVCMGRAPHLGLFSAPKSKDLRISEEALGMVGMFHLRDKPYTQISGGERQLVLIARTIAQQPDVILLDEPTSHLDLKNQALILRMINKLALQGLSVMMSSHLPNHALLFSGKVALMHHGGIFAIGKPDDVISEDSLREIYGIEVKIFTGRDGKGCEEIKFCMPCLEASNAPASDSFIR